MQKYNRKKKILRKPKEHVNSASFVLSIQSPFSIKENKTLNTMHVFSEETLLNNSSLFGSTKGSKYKRNEKIDNNLKYEFGIIKPKEKKKKSFIKLLKK